MTTSLRSLCCTVQITGCQLARINVKAGFHKDRRSQIAKCSAIVCDPAIVIADDYLLRSSAINCDCTIIWKPKFCDLRSKVIP